MLTRMPKRNLQYPQRVYIYKLQFGSAVNKKSATQYIKAAQIPIINNNICSKQHTCF